jgi:hypothetical protein
MSGIQQGLLAAYKVDQGVSVEVDVTGVQASGSPGAVTVNIVNPEVLPAGTVLLFDRPTVGTAIPAGWSVFSDVGGDLNNFAIVGTSGATTRVAAVAGTISITPQTYTTDSQNAHVPANYYPSSGGGPTSSPSAPNIASAGSHTHNVTLAPSPLNSTAFPNPIHSDVRNKQGMRVPLIKTTTDTYSIPAGAIVFSGSSSIFSGFSRKLWPTFNPSAPQPSAAGVYTIAPSVNATIPFPENCLPFISPRGPAIQGASGGAHSHTGLPRTIGLIPGATRPLGGEAGAHIHPIGSFPIARNGGLGIGVWNQFTHLLPCIAASNQAVTSGMIVMFDGSTVPSGWNLCDGTNGTPNLVNSLIGYHNANTNSNEIIGAPAVGGANPAAASQPGWPTTPGPSSTVVNLGLGFEIVATANPHGHNNLLPRTSPVPVTATHITISTPHSHGRVSQQPGAMTMTMPIIPLPENLAIKFIQKA